MGGLEEQAKESQTDLEAIATLVNAAAQKRQGQSLELLVLLRLLESLHQEIRDGRFQKSLPDNRQALYALLKDIESAGGWPHIHRMKLQAFLSRLPLGFLEADSSHREPTRAEDTQPSGTKDSLE